MSQASAPRRSITLRQWQHEALHAFLNHRSANFLAVACPGAGKTTFALTAARHWLRGERLPLVVVAPTRHLKTQWAQAAERFGFHLEPAWDASTGDIPPDMHGIVVTYAQVASAARTLFNVSRGGIVILDEVHHAGGDLSWGEGVAEAFAEANARLLLSGTPFRSDDAPIPFVSYTLGDHGDAVSDYEYDYGKALVDGGVVRPVFFPRFDGHMEWIAADGSHKEASFSDDVAYEDRSARLRTALDAGGQWLPTVLVRADEKLRNLRRQQADAGGLVIAIDQEHARACAALLERWTGERPAIALSDDPKASEVIEQYARSDQAWVVAVRMISEGVDIPRLRVGVHATTTVTPLFFRQAVGRIVRYLPGRTGRQPSYMFMPDDPRLRAHAMGIAEERRHFLKKAGDEDDPRGDAALDEIPAGREDEQLSLFSAVSATPSGEAAVHKVDETLGLFGSLEDDEPVEDGFELQLAEAPHLGTGGGGAAGGNGGAAADAPGLSPVARRRALRDANSVLVRAIAGATGMTHAQVNGELNRRSGVTRVAEADVQALERRRGEGARWLARIGSRSGT